MGKRRGAGVVVALKEIAVLCAVLPINHPKMYFTPTHRRAIFELLAGTFVLLAAAFYNGYPLVFSDSGTYIGSGFEGKIPFDRPIVYGLFLRHASLAVTLWLPIMVQCFLMAWLLRLLLKPWLSEHFTAKYLMILVVLSAITPLSWYACQLMPDIFTSLTLLIIALTLTRLDLSRSLLIMLGVLYVFCCLVHFSHLFLGLITVAGLTVWRWSSAAGKMLLPSAKRLAVVVIWSGIAFLAMPTINWLVEGKFTMGKGSYAFIIGRMVDSGMLKMYLDDYCDKRQYRLCIYKDSLPESSRKFHWESYSPLQKEGGWGASEAEYRDIVWGTLTSPKYIGLHLWESLLSTPTQLMQNAIGSGMDYGWYQSPESPPAQAVKRFFPHELNEYHASRQCVNLWGQKLDFTFLDKVNFWILLGTLLAVIWLIGIHGGDLPAEQRAVFWIFAAGILANAFVTSSLGVIADRFSPRVIWLLTLWVLAVLLPVWQKNRKDIHS